MTVEKALERLSYRFRHWKINEQDIKALNTLIVFTDIHKNKNLINNDLFAKLFIDKFITLASCNRMTAKTVLDKIEDVLDGSVYDQVLRLKDEIPMMKLNAVGLDKIPFDESKWANLDYIRERNCKIADKYKEELLKSLKTPYTEKEAINFVESQVNRILLKHNKDH